MSEARRHHYVPACYLRHFAVPQDRYEGRLWVYDRVRGRSFPSSPDNSAHQRDFYRVKVEGDDPNAEPNLAEDAFATLESRFAPVIVHVNEHRTLPTNPVTMHELFAFVATQAVRTPRVREMQERVYNDTYMLFLQTLADNRDGFMNGLRRFEPGIADDEAEEMYAMHCKSVDAGKWQLDIPQTALVRDTWDLAGELEDILACRHWILGVTPEGTSFITSDDPVYLQPSRDPQCLHPLWSPGFRDANTNVLVPLGPRLLLIGLPYPFHRARLHLSRCVVAEINSALAFAAHRFIYFTGPTFAFIDKSRSLVDGPTETLRMSDARPQRSQLGYFSAE